MHGNEILTCGNKILTCYNEIEKITKNCSMSPSGLHTCINVKWFPFTLFLVNLTKIKSGIEVAMVYCHKLLYT